MNLYLVLICFYIGAVHSKGQIYKIEKQKTDTRLVIKILRNILLTECYAECTKASECETFGYKEIKEEDNFVDCHLLKKTECEEGIKEIEINTVTPIRSQLIAYSFVDFASACL